MRSEPSNPQPIPTGLIAEIDRLRGLFAAMVLFGHALDIATANAASDIFRLPLRHLRPYCGFIWVVGFVVLSGFCIEASCRNMGANFSLRRYLALRATRLLPTLIVATILAGILEAMLLGSPYRPQVWTSGIDGTHFVLNLFGLGGFFGPFGSINPSYTISYELLYYALWGISRWVFRESSTRTLAAMNAAFAIAAVVLVNSGLLTLPPVAAEIFNTFILLIYLPWLAGALLVEEIEGLSRVALIAGLARFAWPVLGLVLIAGRKWLGQPQYQVSVGSTVYYLVLAAAFGLLLVRGQLNSASRKPNSMDRQLGLLSYPLYLIHGPAIVLTGFALKASGFSLSFVFYLIILLAAGLSAGFVMAHLIERPILRLRRSLVGGTKRTSDVVAVAPR